MTEIWGTETVSVSQIRLATADDIEAIVQFNIAMAAETEEKELPPAVVRSGVAAAINDSTLARYFLATNGAEIIGQLMLTTEWSDWRDGQIWWIQSVYVRPDCRRRGVFRALYRHVEGLAGATAGVVGLRLYVEQNNQVAQRVYKELGMRDAGYVVFEKMLSQ
jgi:ribosomal protein S18 acetylase RimI-like enzyme